MSRRILRSPDDLNPADIRALYDGFDAPISGLDCGQMCAPHNPNRKPFCCDICHAVPAAYTSEWNSLQDSTDLWHPWRGDECAGQDASGEHARLRADTPAGMLLLACLGPQACQRNFRALSCRQFPFYPYVTADYCFIGLAYEWEFLDKCWVISNLERVSNQYRDQFIQTFDFILAHFQEEFENYADHSAQMRSFFTSRKRRIPILHRNGRSYLLSPASGRLQRIGPAGLPKFGPYKL